MTRLFLLVSLLLGTAASAAPPTPWVAVLRTSSPEDAQLVGRVRGQISDLPVALRVRPAPAPGASVEEQWRAAEALAGEGSARVVLWFSTLPGELRVHLADLDSQRLLVRSVPVDPHRGRAGQSATAEAAALVVRSALSALVDGIPVGELVAHRIAPSLRPHVGVAPPPSALPPVLSELAPPSWALPPRVTLPFQAPTGAWRWSLGWQASLDGHSPRGQQGAQVGLGWEEQTWRVRALFMMSLPAQLSDAYTRVSLSRHALGAGLDLTVLSTRHWRLGAGLGVGIAGFLRSTTALTPDVAPSDPRLIPSLYVGPELSARWRGGPVGVEASLAADVVAGAPTLVYQQAQQTVVRNQLWVVQPRLALTLLLGSS